MYVALIPAGPLAPSYFTTSREEARPRTLGLAFRLVLCLRSRLVFYVAFRVQPAAGRAAHECAWMGKRIDSGVFWAAPRSGSKAALRGPTVALLWSLERPSCASAGAPRAVDGPALLMP